MLSEALEHVQVVVGADGQPTAALLDIMTWHALIALLEEAEDQGIVRAYLTRRAAAGTPEEAGLISWEQAEARFDAHEEA